MSDKRQNINVPTLLKKKSSRGSRKSGKPNVKVMNMHNVKNKLLNEVENE